MDNKDDMKKKHSGDLSTLWDIYQSDGKFYKNIFFVSAVVLSLTLVAASSFSDANYYYLIQDVSASTVSILPSLLGFSLGAYILVVGFGSSDILSVITRPLIGQKNYSLYQKLNAVFGITVIFEITTLLLSVLVIYFDKVLPDSRSTNEYINTFFDSINCFWLFVVLFCMIYSILMLINITKQVFIFAQTIHFCVSDIAKKAQLPSTPLHKDSSTDQNELK